MSMILLAAAATAYHAVGTEPFWALTIDDRQMRVEQPGVPPVAVRSPVARPSFNGRRYVTRAMTVDITRTPCSDGMSDRRYPDTVTVRIGRRTLSGCGGLALATAPVEGSWTLAAVDGRPLRLDRPATVRFAAGQIEGRVCNGFSAAYREGDGVVQIGAIRATRMACPGGTGLAEARLFALAAEPLTATAPRPGTLVLTGRSGSATFIRRR